MAVNAFDETYYLTKNRDVYTAVAKGILTAKEHFDLYGANEGRRPNEFFDPHYYGSVNSDVRTAVAAKAFTTVFDHYVKYGYDETKLLDGKAWRAPSAEVAKVIESLDIDAYVKANPDAAQNPFKYYLANGLDQGTGSTPRKGPGATSQDFNLTPGQDYLAGTDGPDNFYGTIDNTQVHTSLNAYDVIDGGKGDDRLVVHLAANYGGGATVKNIETLQVGTNTSATFDYNTNLGRYEITGVDKVVLDQINSGETLTIDHLTRKEGEKGDIPVLSWVNDHTTDTGLAGSVNVNYRASTVAGNDDLQKISLTRVRNGDLTLSSGIETVSLESAGKGATNSIFTIASGETLKKVEITGEGNLGAGRKVGGNGLDTNYQPTAGNDEHVSFVKFGSSVKEVNAKDAKGNLYVEFTDAATPNNVTFTGGEGNDQVIVNAGTVKLDGGKGNDTFIVKQTNDGKFSPGDTFGVKQTNQVSSGVALDEKDVIAGGEGTDTLLIDYAASALGGTPDRVTLSDTQLQGLSGIDVLDIRAAKSNIHLSNAFVSKSDNKTVEVVTSRIVQNEKELGKKIVTDEIDSRHQIDLTGVTNPDCKLKVTGGDGRESIIIDNAFSANHTVSGGEGHDALIVYNSTTVTDGQLANVTGFDTINLVKNNNRDAQKFEISLSADFLNRVADPSVQGKHGKDEANALRIVSVNGNAEGAGPISPQTVALDSKDTIVLEVDVTGLTTANAINVDQLLGTGATVSIVDKNTKEVLLQKNTAGKAGLTEVEGKGIFAKSAPRPDAPPASPLIGTPPNSGASSAGKTGGGQPTAGAAGNTIRVTGSPVTLAPDSEPINADKPLTDKADTIKGGGFIDSDAEIRDATAGDGDTLFMNLDGKSVTPAIAGIENISVRATGAASTLDFTSIRGVETVTVSGTGALTLNSVGNGLKLKPTSGANISLIPAIKDSGADKATILLEGVVAGLIDVGTSESNDIDELTINSGGGSANSLTLTTNFTASGEKIIVTGSQNLTIKTAMGTSTALPLLIDASAVTGTGKVTLELTDALTTSATTARTYDASALKKVDGLTLRGAGSATLDQTISKLGPISEVTLQLNDGVTGRFANNLSLTSLSPSALTLNLKGGGTGLEGNLSATGIGTLTINSTDVAHEIKGTTSVSATGAIKLVGDQNVTFTGVVTAGSLDASGLTGSAKLALGTISGTPPAYTFANGAASAMTVTGSAGDDLIVIGGATGATGGGTVKISGGTDTISLGSGVDTVEFSQLPTGGKTSAIYGFAAANDKLKFTGALALDYKGLNDAVAGSTAVTGGVANFATHKILALDSSATGVVGGLGGVLNAIVGAARNAEGTAGLVIQKTTSGSNLYYVKDVLGNSGTGTITAEEITLIGTFNVDMLTAANVAIG